jgi:hypothetical protein
MEVYYKKRRAIKNRKKKIDFETSPKREPTKLRDFYNDCSDPIAAWKRYFRSRLGEKWNDIYSDIKKEFDKHRFDIDWYVDLNVFKNGDKVFDSRGRELYNKSFYVYNGILCYYEKPKIKRVRPIDYIPVDGYTVMRKENGIWYILFLKDLPGYSEKQKDYHLYGKTYYVKTKEWHKPWQDVFLKLNSNYSISLSVDATFRRLKEVYGVARYCYRVKQANSKEIQRFAVK